MKKIKVTANPRCCLEVHGQNLQYLSHEQVNFTTQVLESYLKGFLHLEHFPIQFYDDSKNENSGLCSLYCWMREPSEIAQNQQFPHNLLPVTYCPNEGELKVRNPHLSANVIPVDQVVVYHCTVATPVALRPHNRQTPYWLGCTTHQLK